MTLLEDLYLDQKQHSATMAASAPAATKQAMTMKAIASVPHVWVSPPLAEILL